MISKTLNIWEQTLNNPPKEYLECFEAENKMLKKNLTKQSVILDVGSGTGRTIKQFAPLVKKFFGIDNDPKAVEVAKKSLDSIDNIEIYCEDIEKTHFKNKKFDLVFIGLTFCNFGESRKTILTEIKRILKDNGSLIFSVFNQNALPYRKKTYKDYEGGYTIIDKKKGYIKFNKDGAISEQFNKKEITSILNKADFYILNILSGKMFYIIHSKKII